MLGIPIGLAYANASEWLIHKYVLHGRGKKRSSFWSFHFHEHHRAARKHGHYDADYETLGLGDNPQNREALGLVALSVLHAPLLPVAPFFTATVWYSAVHYWRVHRRSHLEPEWARENLSWHYDHHMGPNQDANWCVTRPWMDQLMGTREPYVGTEREQKDIARREAHERMREARSQGADKAA
jgi:sterol desaturase/sphingolipid hydroxylase (fatty acid hydroxylase superfamily)